MHEWALAQSIVATVAAEIEEHGLRKAIKVDVRVGELQQIDLDIFRSLLEGVAKTYELSLSMEDIALSKEKSVLKCRVCGNEWGFDDASCGLSEDQGEAIHFIPEVAHAYMRCPRCGSPDFEILKGRGVWIASIEGET